MFHRGTSSVAQKVQWILYEHRGSPRHIGSNVSHQRGSHCFSSLYPEAAEASEEEAVVAKQHQQHRAPTSTPKPSTKTKAETNAAAGAADETAAEAAGHSAVEAATAAAQSLFKGTVSPLETDSIQIRQDTL